LIHFLNVFSVSKQRKYPFLLLQKAESIAIL